MGLAWDEMFVPGILAGTMVRRVIQQVRNHDRDMVDFVMEQMKNDGTI